MTNISHDGTELPSREVMILGGLFLTLLALSLTALGIWSLGSVHHEYRNSLAEGAPILIHRPGISFFYLGFPGLAGLFLFGCCALASGVRQSREEAKKRRCMKIAGYLVVIGLVSMFAGRYAANWYWEDVFRDAGYKPCEASFSITHKWDQKVWVQDTAFCDNEEVLRMFASYKHDLEDINEYLKTRATKE